MDLDLYVALAGLVVGFTVGLTGMGGGALMTPILVLFFGVQPLAAVSSDLVAAFVMKPVGGAVHLRRGTVHLPLVRWLTLGSVPCAFLGVVVLRSLGSGDAMQNALRLGLGGALLVAAGTMVAKAFIGVVRNSRELRTDPAARARPRAEVAFGELRIRPLPTVLIGAVGGLVVGMTSVGSGSLIIVALLLVYPRLQASQLVGTDLVQAIPLVASAALGHVLFGDFSLGLTVSVLLGSLPGVYLGARVSAQAPGRVVRRALMVVLAVSGLKLVGVATMTLGAVALTCAVVAPLLWMLLRRSFGLPATVPAPQMAGVPQAHGGG